MNRACKNIYNVQTPLIMWGTPLSNSETVIICITGNPGISDFYVDFASEVHKRTSIPVCVIGHAGHEECFPKNNKYLFNLKDQLEHKLDFIVNHIDKNSKIHFIGHSIGAWMILELLEEENQLNNRISSVNLLFPTLQKMAESRNGKFVNNVLRKIYSFLLLLITLLHLLPERALQCLIGCYLRIKSLPSKYNSAVIKILYPDIAANIFFLAFNEMDTVKSLNTQSLERIKHLTNVVYASDDGWAPLEYMDDLKKFMPQLQMTEAHNVEHAFVLNSSEKVASIVADFINAKANRT